MSRGRRKNANDNKIRAGRRIAEHAEFHGCRKELLQLAILVLVIILLMASTTSIPTGNVGVLTLFGRRDRRNASGRDSPGQSTEIGAKAFGADAIGERERQRAVK